MKPTDTGHINNVRVDQVNVNKGDKAAKPAPQSSVSSQDKVTLTDQAASVQNMQQTAKAYPDIDTAKVEAIKAAIASGNFEIDVDKIASRLVDIHKDLK
jgi:negative regulator of flagellin synthesis FlgM